MVTDAWGIDDGYDDAHGVWRAVGVETARALRAAMDTGDGAWPDSAESAIVIRRGDRPAITGVLTLEDGATVRVDRALPADIPLGYHSFRDRAGDHTRRLIVAPDRCRIPTPLWGWAAQVYATRSEASWGIGDLGDLARLARWSKRELDASVILVNPLFAAIPLTPREASPYSPSSRRYRDPLYLRIEDVPGAREAGVAVEELARLGRALNAERRIDRDQIATLKRRALEQIWSHVASDPAFERYRAEQGEALREFAIYMVLAEHHGSGWQRWPAEHRQPTTPAVARFARDHARAVSFHEWVQWLLDRQLERAAAEIAIVQDLPIGVDQNGADAWAWQDVITTGASVGAPPDRYNARGQDWGLPPMVPHRLRAAGYEPFIQTVRAALRHAGGLRIDHVMGLFRLFWIPRGRPPAQGGYVRYPADDLLAILALESHRAGAFVVGEDLGTVEAGVRERLAANGVLSYRVTWFESEPPRRYPELAMAAVTTHDLPTIAGLWTGADLKEQQKLGLDPNAEAIHEIRSRLAALTGVGEDADVRSVIETTHRLLAEAPSLVVSATLDDALGVEDRPNMPGTRSAERPNWSLALPASLEMIETSRLPRAVAEALRAGRRDRERIP